MKIVVETERKSWDIKDFHGPPAISIVVKVDGQEDIGLSHILAEAEMQSHFDILWDYLGQKIKSYNEKEHGYQPPALSKR